MAECKSCIHGNVCLHKSNIETDTYAYMDVKFDTEKCKHFMSADVVEVRHGEWEIVIGSNGKEKMVCTNCRHQQDLASTFTYCPNCGARMSGAKMKGGAV